MAINIQIAEKHLNELKSFYVDKREKLKSEIDEVNEILTQLGEPATRKAEVHAIALATDAPTDYPFKAVWFDKIKYAINVLGGAATTSDIADKICSIEIGSDRRKVVATISSVLSTHSKEGGAFIKTLNERRESLFSNAKKLRQMTITDNDDLI